MYVVEKTTRVTSEEIRGRSRKQHIAKARHIFCYIASHYGGHALSAIGGYVNRDHSTILHSLSQIEDMVWTGEIEMRYLTRIGNIAKQREANKNYNIVAMI
jgi:chromosomal replication initiation ATPase DnaA